MARLAKIRETVFSDRSLLFGSGIRYSAQRNRVMNPARPQEPWKGTYFIGRYRVVDEIGVGGMASVLLARVDGAGGFQKWVAIKRIHPHLTENQNIVSMFLDEARVAASISHPNVAQVFDLGQHEGGYWIAMEYLHGEPVRELYRHCEENACPLDPTLVARIVVDSAEGLHAAHELRGKSGEPLNLVHRDVSPHNLFVTYDGVVKVVDFGIAKMSGRQVQTRTGFIRGKLAYMAPEQARALAVDRRTDVFALGVVAWELLTGKRLFRTKSDLETVRQVLSMPIPRPSELNPAVPLQLDAAIMRALERNPAARHQTARDFSRAIQQYLVSAGQIVGPEEVAAFLNRVFRDRVAKGDAHLKWAADVTQTLSLESSTQNPATPEAAPPASASFVFPLQRNPADAPAPVVTVPSPDQDFEPDLMTEVRPTWGVEWDHSVAVPARVPALPPPPPPPMQPVPAEPSAAFAPQGPLPPIAPNMSASQPWIRRMLAASLTFFVLSLLGLALVFVFRSRIRSTLGIPSAGSSVVPSPSP